ncbi:MAG: NAD(P)H-dependent oxidoreductase subunit E, partial [Bacteroidota bacterium]
MEENLIRLFAKYPTGRKENLLLILQEIQFTEGVLSEENLERVASHLAMPVNRVYSVATFYDQFKFKSKNLKTTPRDKTRMTLQEIGPADKTFLLDRILKNFTNDLTRPETENLRILKRERVLKPYIFIGSGTCGLEAGAGETIAAIHQYLLENNIDAEVMEVGCIGCCMEEPLMDVQLPGKARISFKQVTRDKVEGILEAVINKTVNPEEVLGQYPVSGQDPWPNIPMMSTIPWFDKQQRNILALSGIISPFTIVDYISRGGYKELFKSTMNYIPEKVCDIIEQSELRGRSGSGFPTGKKWKVALNTAGDEKYLICNADDSNPEAFIDGAIIEGNPHLLLEGIAIASYAIGANNAFIYIRSDYTKCADILDEAIRQAKEYKILGANIFGSGFNLNIHLRMGAGAFVCGEETALISSLEGKRGMPRNKPPFPAEAGLFGRPTVVNNAETLVNVPGILLNGPAWFKTIGTKNSKGTKVFSISGSRNNDGLIEVPMGTTLRDIIYSIRGSSKEMKPIKAVEGHYLGSGYV